VPDSGVLPDFVILEGIDGPTDFGDPQPAPSPTAPPATEGATTPSLSLLGAVAALAAAALARRR
jgi:hypothetical protein